MIALCPERVKQPELSEKVKAHTENLFPAQCYWSEPMVTPHIKEKTASLMPKR